MNAVPVSDTNTLHISMKNMIMNVKIKVLPKIFECM
jgi:hypothetical protein